MNFVVVTLVVTAAVLGGCSKEQQVALQAQAAKNKADYRSEVVTVMKQVQPYVTDRDLAACRQALETSRGLGATYKVTGPLAPHIGYSCDIQGRDRSGTFTPQRPAIGYTARIVKVGQGIGGDQETAFCGFVLEGKQVRLHHWQKNTKTHGYNTCTGLQ